jgi:hypothetical protein
MKSMNLFIRQMIMLPLISISALCFSQGTFESLALKKETSKGNVEFLKSEGNMLVFEVNLRQVPQKGCLLRISNEAGDVIFEKKITTETYKQTYRIDRSNASKISFEATGKNFLFREAFDLRMRIEEKLEVVKM